MFSAIFQNYICNVQSIAALSQVSFKAEDFYLFIILYYYYYVNAIIVVQELTAWTHMHIIVYRN